MVDPAHVRRDNRDCPSASYAQIGILAPLPLHLVRTVQGFSASGEYAGAMSLLNAMRKDRLKPHDSEHLSFVANWGGLSQTPAAASVPVGSYDT